MYIYIYIYRRCVYTYTYIYIYYIECLYILINITVYSTWDNVLTSFTHTDLIWYTIQRGCPTRVVRFNGDIGEDGWPAWCKFWETMDKFRCGRPKINGLVRGKIYRKPWFLPSHIGVSCNFFPSSNSMKRVSPRKCGDHWDHGVLHIYVALEMGVMGKNYKG